MAEGCESADPLPRRHCTRDIRFVRCTALPESRRALEVTMNFARTEGTPDGAWAPILDLSGRPVEFVDLADDSPIGQVLRRILASLDDPTAVMSAFGSFVSDD